MLLDQQHAAAGAHDRERDLAEDQLCAFGARPVQAVVDRPRPRQGGGEQREGGALASAGAGGGELLPAFGVGSGHADVVGAAADAVRFGGVR